ncbi:MAG: DNA mismatch repair endonuclease MutL, partial [Pirellulaceae bacterium]|nr:DNA mismatch repair endonuclease MutL [Pirellulaceae bacterium]
MPQIRQLPPDVVNKIAAGEVVERPASVVKELMENSVDAGARRVEVSLEQGGMQLIRVADDGCGISEQQLPLAVASHATSKIANADDLFRVGTLGFRGEALASIAAISRLRIRARQADAEAGAELEVLGGQLSAPVPVGCPVGTTIEVHDLFFNTPVRRKFMRTTQTEVGHACEAFTRIALACPELHLALRHNQRVLHELPPCERWRDRIAALFGGELAEGLIWVESHDEQARISGYVADPQFSRAANRMQYLFLNGRAIRDRSLQHALSEAYRGLLMTGRQPIVFLRLEMPPDLVDVNVHPTKQEVRFVDSGRLYSQLLGAIRNKFLTTDLTARVGATEAAAAGPAPAAPENAGPGSSPPARNPDQYRSLPGLAPGGGTAAYGPASSPVSPAATQFSPA